MQHKINGDRNGTGQQRQIDFSANIGMVDDGHGLGIRIFHIPNGRSLNALFGVLNGMFQRR